MFEAEQAVSKKARSREAFAAGSEQEKVVGLSGRDMEEVDRESRGLGSSTRYLQHRPQVGSWFCYL